MSRAPVPPATGPGRRRLVLVCLLLVAGALALWGSSRLAWFSVPMAAGGTGPVGASGAEVVPALTGVAVLAAAAVAAAVAVAGIARRVLGAIVALAAVATAMTVAGVFAAPPSAGELAGPAGGTVAAGAAAVDVTPAPWLGLTGTVFLLVAGLALVLAESSLARLGSRYAAPADRRPAVDRDRAAWNELDAGRDPTVETADPERAGPGGGPRPGRV